ncbi:MAG: sigma-54-dependent Fis family transcriptional regulator [Alphaproteobacteria bacterium]|nr:sigma-54-dependent Fis family transcriptional regulator [Alphaproteobacteria bacterium]
MSWLDLALTDDTDWERLAARPEAAPSPLDRCWIRSHRAGVSVDGPSSDPIVTDGTLRAHREPLDRVLRLLDEVLAPCLGVFQARDFTLLFADRDGLIVDQRAGGGFAEAARAVRLQAGAAWDEPTRGTNAIGTALVEQRPVAVRGAAHFARPNHGLVCYAAPVHDPWGEIVGVLDATSFVVRADPLAGAAVVSVARALEEALRIATLTRAQGTLVDRLLGRLRDPALLVAPDGRVTAANALAVARGLTLGRTLPAGADVVRTRARVDQVLGLDVDALATCGTRRSPRPDLEVEPVHAVDGRVAAWLVVLVGGPAATPQERVPPASVAPRATPPADDGPFRALVGTDAALVAVRDRARRLARSTLPVLIQGETGTGKELLARGVHAASGRAAGPFVAVNCGALSPAILHAELFGYVGGAFTGADPGGRTGRLASADGGTLFLDELAEMPEVLQALLLRFLDDGTYHRVGDDRPRHADVRVVAATCRDLPTRVADGTFRADLYHRLCGATLTLPPLRARDDVGLLAGVLVAQLGEAHPELQARAGPPVLSVPALQWLARQPWPGNVRQLRLALHHALVMADGADVVDLDHLPGAVPPTPSRRGDDASEPVARPTPPPGAPATPALAQTQAEAVRRALRAARGNVSAAARALGIARSTVYRLVQRHGIEAPPSDG